MTRRRVFTRAVAVGAVLGVALVAGAGSAWAYLTAHATASGTIRTPTVAVTPLDTTQLGVTLTNRQPYLGTLKSFRVVNEGDVEGTVTVSLASAEQAAAALGATLWRADPVMGCVSVPASPASGTWRDATLAPFTLAAGASQTLCVTTALPLENRDAVASPTGSATIATTLVVELVGVGTGWTAHTEAAVSHSTRGIYPLSTAVVPVEDSQWFALRSADSATICLDGTLSTTSRVTGSTCSLTQGYPAPSQFWQLIPVDAADTSLVTLRPRHAPAQRLTFDPDGAPTLTAADEGSIAQQWYLQRTESGIQLVSAVDGRCLLLPSSASPNGASTGNCADSAWSQIAFERYPLLFETGGEGTTLTIGTEVSTAELRVQRLDGSTWKTMTELYPLSKISTRFAGVTLNDGLNELRVVFPDGGVAYTLSVYWDSPRVTPGRGFE